MPIISNTEVTTYNTCERQHYYRFALKVEPKFASVGLAIARGVVGHEALDVYYTLLQHEVSVDEAKQAAIEVIHTNIKRVINETPEEFELLKVLADLTRLIDGYVENYRVEPFKVLETEKFFSAPLVDDILYGMRLDLLVQYISGPERGNIAVMDHKFLYNFKQQRDLEMDGQLSKYMRTVILGGDRVSFGVFNQIRYRPLKDPKPSDIFKRVKLRAKNKEVDRIWLEQSRSARKIQDLKELPVAEYSDIATRNLNPYICKGCFFQSLCKTELMGNDISNMLLTEFQPNSYGYDQILSTGE